jgi:ubiquinone/menaquinone biosynthesis C-methylase UbiE
MDSDKEQLAADSEAVEAALQYDRFFGPFYFEPYAIEVANRLDVGEEAQVLELASGTGRVTRHIRNRIPASAKLIASDIDEIALGIAKRELGEADIEWRIIDGQEIPFANDTMDTVVCCFAYMFMPDRVKAFKEAFRVLKPGGVLLFTTWDTLESNGASFTSRSVAKDYLEDPLPDNIDDSTSMNAEVLVRALLQEAGFTRMTVEKKQLFGTMSSAKEAAQGFVDRGGVVYDLIAKRNPAAIDEIKIRLEKELGEKYGEAPMIAPMSALISQAWK